MASASVADVKDKFSKDFDKFLNDLVNAGTPAEQDRLVADIRKNQFDLFKPLNLEMVDKKLPNSDGNRLHFCKVKQHLEHYF